MALTQISTKGIKDGTILNADINASAAIAGTKISPDFGSQNITTTGTVAIGTLTVDGADTATGSGGPVALNLRAGDANDEFVNLSFQTGSGGPLGVISAIADATGVYPNTTGQLRFSTQVGSGLFERMSIKSDGKVGINTVSPSELFTINGADQSALIRTSNAVGTAKLKFEADGTNYAGIGLENTTLVLRCGNSSSPSSRLRLGADGVIVSSGNMRVNISTASDGILGEAYGGYFGLKHADQTLSSEYMIISNDTNTYISCSSGSSIYLRPSANSPTHETVFAHDITTYKTDIMMNGHVLGRSQHQWGHLQGGFNNIGASQSKTNPIFTIGSNYNPAESTLNDMYGIGFSHGNASFTPPTAGWGMYACADGDARIFLDATHARIYLDSNLSNTNTDAMYLAPTTGNYGSIQINGGTTGGWLGYSIAATAVFMSNGDIAGLYNDIENEWYAYGNRNGQWRTFYNGLQRTNTSNTGLTVTGTVNETSDIALKENIQPLTNALENLKKLKGYSYNFIDNKAKALGIVAQDVEKVYPDIVEGEEGEKSVAYSGLIAVLIEAIKELETEVAALKAS